MKCESNGVKCPRQQYGFICYQLLSPSFLFMRCDICLSCCNLIYNNNSPVKIIYKYPYFNVKVGKPFVAFLNFMSTIEFHAIFNLFHLLWKTSVRFYFETGSEVCRRGAYSLLSSIIYMSKTLLNSYHFIWGRRN